MPTGHCWQGGSQRSHGVYAEDVPVGSAERRGFGGKIGPGREAVGRGRPESVFGPRFDERSTCPAHRAGQVHFVSTRQGDQLSSLSFQYFWPATVACRAKPVSVIE